MTYKESLEYIYNAKSRGAEKQGLVNITELLRRLGDPQRRFPSVHVAGTNGKGSVCAFTAAILGEADLKVGLYTSPFLQRFTERIRIGDTEIPEDAFAEVATEVRREADAMAREGLIPPTFFELTTACCFLYFAREAVDVAVIETGLGGRTDATNVLQPVATAVTAIGIDHAHALGGTIELIAGEKAGIIKPGVPCVASVQQHPAALEVLSSAAEQANAPFLDCSDCAIELLEDTLDGQRFNLRCGTVAYDYLQISLLGAHQLGNAATAVLLVECLRQAGFPVPHDAVIRGLRRTCWTGRMEVLRREPLILLDGAHNPQGAAALADGVRRYVPGGRACLVVGAMADKDAAHMVDALAGVAARVIATAPPSHGRQQHAPEELAALFAQSGVPTETELDYTQAIRLALASGIPVVVCGSLYLAGAARTWLEENEAIESAR